jgi:hypothetical protein
MNSKGEYSRKTAQGWALPVLMSLAWLGAWVWVRGAFMVWMIMFVVYVFAIACVILFGPAPGRSVRFDLWRGRFFATGGALVASGLLSILYLIVLGLVFLVIGLIRGGS